LAYDMVHKQSYTTHERPREKRPWYEGVRRKATDFPSEGGGRATEQEMPTERTSHAEQPLGGHRDQAPETLRVWLLGDFRVVVGSSSIQSNAWRLKKAATLVKLLALAPGHRLHREQAMEALWPEANRKAASNNLRTTLHAARKILDSMKGYRYLASEDDSLVLCPQGSLLVDVDAFEEAAATARRSRDPATYRAAIELYAGDLLPEDRYEAWAEERREQLRRTFLELLLELARLYERSGDWEAAIQASRRVVEADPHREEAHVSLMRINAISGRSAEALAQYGALEETLRRVGAEPSASSRTLRDEIALGTFVAASAEDQRGYSLHETAHAAGNHNLPGPRDNFVGREREIVEVKRTLAMTRLLTLTGAGGSGKTRLALEIARDLVAAYPDGVWMVELAPLSEPELVAQEVAGALGVTERPGEPLIDTLADALGDKGLLLVLDNCEHLVEAAARLVDALLDSCSRLKVLATSREPLGVKGEVLWKVPPLSVPDADGVPDAASTAESLMGYEAVRLFVDRVRLRLLDFGLTQENSGAVARVCQRLEGIPLAIELATARMGPLAVEQVAHRLEDSLALLTGGSRTAAPRQQTLRTTLDWSHNLLGEVEKALFRRLSVFAGGWTLEAAEEVCSGGCIERDDVLDLLGGLVDKSLVVTGEATEGTVRYRMLEPIRQYAREKLEESGEADQIKSSHTSFFLALAEEAEPQLSGSGQGRWLECIEANYDNMRAALSWAFARGQAESGLRLAGALWSFWWARGYYAEGRRWLEEALTVHGPSSSVARARALEGVCWLALEQGYMDRAEAAAQEGLGLSADAGLKDAVVAAFTGILGDVAHFQGRYERAVDHYEESLVLHRAAGDLRGIAWSLLDLANALARHDHRRATELYDEGLVLSRELGGAQPLGYFLISVGYDSLLKGDLKRATTLNEEAAALLRNQGHRGGLQYALDNLGWIALARLDHVRARALHEECLLLCRELGDRRNSAESLEGLACVAGAKGEAVRAAMLFGAAWGLHDALGYQQTPDEQALREPYLTNARSKLDEAAWEAAFAEGRAMTFEEAVEYALSEEEIGSPTTPVTEEPLTTSPAAALTRREQDVAILVAKALTNRQIASHLMLSEHTVATHVRHILKKLGLHSRTQIAAYFRERH
jgi:predicted ATPase/DNA-binding SARP family transcriptional activator/DNA-binding CsgD family transcriptional regulator